MAGLTKDELKSALIAHGVEQNLSAAKKDELVELYEEFVAPHDEKAGEFSSDDENLSPTTRSSRYRNICLQFLYMFCCMLIRFISYASAGIVFHQECKQP